MPRNECEAGVAGVICTRRKLTVKNKPKPLKQFPVLLTYEDAERFVDETDLPEYDFSGFKPMKFELRRKDAPVNVAVRTHQTTRRRDWGSLSKTDAGFDGAGVGEYGVAQLAQATFAQALSQKHPKRLRSANTVFCCQSDTR